MWHSFLSCKFSQFIEQHMKLIFGLKIGEATVTETLERTIRYHGAHVLHVRHECLQVRNVKVDGLVFLKIFFILVYLEDSF